jgi:protein-tyrosine phosphatase
MKAIYAESQIDGLVESAGTADFNVGNPADHRSIKVAAEAGIDITDHRARQVTASDFERFDLIYVMDRDNERALLSIAPPAARVKIRRICAPAASASAAHSASTSAAAPVAASARHIADVPDPYHGEMSHFREVFHLLHERCHHIAKSLEFGVG